MRAATIRCPNPNCRLLFDVVFGERVYYVPCPDCQQMAIVPDDATPITGRCTACNRPLDDHRLADESYACPGK